MRALTIVNAIVLAGFPFGLMACLGMWVEAAYAAEARRGPSVEIRISACASMPTTKARRQCLTTEIGKHTQAIDLLMSASRGKVDKKQWIEMYHTNIQWANSVAPLCQGLTPGSAEKTLACVLRQSSDRLNAVSDKIRALLAARNPASKRIIKKGEIT